MPYNKIAALCAQRSISIAKLERATGISNGTIGKWRNSSPTADKLKKVADYLGCTVDELLASDDVSRPD